MKSIHFVLMGMLLFFLLLGSCATTTFSEEPNGTRSPGASVKVKAISANQTGIPTKTLAYVFEINNTGDENDTFDIFVDSQNDWIFNVTQQVVGPLEANQTAQVIVNITVPMGWPSGNSDNLTFRARSNNDFSKSDIVSVTTNVSAMFVIGLDVEGGYERVGLIDEQDRANYTISIRNKGNVDVSIKLVHTPPTLLGWDVLITDFPSGIIAIDAPNLTHEFVKEVNLTVSAPENAQPDDLVTIVLWGEKTDIAPPWYSWLSQDNITITTTVQPVLDISFEPENHTGFVDFNETLYNFTVTNSGNKRVEVNLVAHTDLLIIPSIDYSHMTLEVGMTTDVNTLRANTARNTPLGNYTINVTAEDASNGAIIGYYEFYYIVIPRLNITNISISTEDPIQYQFATITATIENIGYVDARNVTVNFFDGSKKIGKTNLDYINSSQTERAKLRWEPSDFGNRSILVSIDVEGKGNFSEHGNAISVSKRSFDIDINWQPYYLGVFIIIDVVLGIAVISSLLELRFYGGVPQANDLGDEGEVVEVEEEDYHDEELPPLDENGEIGDKDEKPFGTFGVMVEPERRDTRPIPPRYERKKSPDFPPPPKPVGRPVVAEPVLAKDPETMRMERELREQMVRVEDELSRTKSQGVDTNNIDQLLNTTKKNLAEGEHAKAKQYLGYAQERLKNLNAKRNEAVSAIREAREIISGMSGSEDLTIVENFLVKADSLLKEGDYREAINYARKAKERAQRLQRREMRL